jgi:hypothetical protein
MEDFIYIILGILWVAWSLYSNKQKMDKKKAEQAQREFEARQYREPAQPDSTPAPYQPIKPVEKSPERNILEEIFGEYIPAGPEAEQDEYLPEVDEQSWERKMSGYSESEVQSLEEIKEEVSADYFSNKYAQGYKTVEHRVTNPLPSGYEENEDTSVLEEFDLKQAVLYSEILRAPYISDAS